MRGLELVPEGVLVRGYVVAAGEAAALVGDAVDDAVFAGGFSAFGVAVVFGDSAPDHGTGLEAGQALVGALRDVVVAALVIGGAHGPALGERLLGGSLGLSLSLGLGGVFSLNLDGDILEQLLLGGRGLGGHVLLGILVLFLGILLLVLGPLRAVEIHGGLLGLGLGLGLGLFGLFGLFGSGHRVGFLNLVDRVLADGVLKVILEELVDVHGVYLRRGIRGCLLQGILVGLLVDGKYHGVGDDVVRGGGRGARDANLGLVDRRGDGVGVAAGAEEGLALVLAGVVGVAPLGAVLAGELVAAAADIEAGGFSRGLAGLLGVARDRVGRGGDVEEFRRVAGGLLGLERGHGERGVLAGGGHEVLGDAETSLGGAGRDIVFPGGVDVAREAGRSGRDGERLESDDVSEGVLPAVVGGVVPGPEYDVAVGALARLALAGAEEVKGTAVELASLDVLDENLDLALEAIGEIVGRGGFGVELLDERVGLGLVELGGLDLNLLGAELVGEGSFVGVARGELGLEGSDASVVVVVVAAGRGEIGLGDLELILDARHLDGERVHGDLALLELRDFLGADGELGFVLSAGGEVLVEPGGSVEALGVLEVELVLCLAGLLELVVLVLELVLEVGDDVVLVGAREVLVLAAVTDLEELGTGVDDGLLEVLDLLLQLDVLGGERLVVVHELRDLIVKIVQLRERVVGDVIAADVLFVVALAVAQALACVDCGGHADTLGVGHGRGRLGVLVRLALVRNLAPVLGSVLDRADLAELGGVGRAEPGESAANGDGHWMRRGGGHDAGADEQGADGHGAAVADGPGPRAALALLAHHEGRALVRQERARHLRCGTVHGDDV